MPSMELKVANAYNEDVGKGYARLDAETRMKLGVDVGDVVAITGKETTPAFVWRMRNEDEGKGIVRIESILRRNTGCTIGDKVTLEKAEVKPAKKVILAPSGDWWQQESIAGAEGFIKHHLDKKPVLKGNGIIVPGFLFTR
ncbi:MAG: hypothetical protein QCI38_08980, partial [Candidatus Thermoplasmatota archaeon]|nr:hypothetical protein [Candidatus Thermoplasmatota archaeon]